MSYLCRTSCKVCRQKQARIIKGTRGNWILQCPACACACERRTKTAAMCLGNIIATYGSQSIQSDWHEGWKKVYKNKNRNHQKSRSKRNTLNRFALRYFYSSNLSIQLLIRTIMSWIFQGRDMGTAGEQSFSIIWCTLCPWFLIMRIRNLRGLIEKILMK